MEDTVPIELSDYKVHSGTFQIRTTLFQINTNFRAGERFQVVALVSSVMA